MMNTDKIYAEKVINEYSIKDTSKVVALKNLDRHVKFPANLFAYIYGVISALLLGVGMCLTMQVIGDGSTILFVVGIVAGIIGIIGAATDYFFYKKILNHRKQKYAGDIIELAKDITKE